MNNKWKTLLSAALLSTVMPLAAAAQGGPLKILVLDDMSGIFAANGGRSQVGRLVRRTSYLAASPGPAYARRRGTDQPSAGGSGPGGRA